MVDDFPNGVRSLFAWGGLSAERAAELHIELQRLEGQHFTDKFNVEAGMDIDVLVCVEMPEVF